MNIIAVDDERRPLKLLELALHQIAPDSRIHGFSSAAEALAHARAHRVDVAFLDIMLGEMSGLLLAKQLKDIHPQANIIFVTGYSDYANAAFDLRASGYLLKPISPQRVKTELENLRNPIAAQAEPHIRIQCFGSFALFVDGTPIPFTRAKPKELLAYLVHKRGAAITNAQIAAVLWEQNVDTRSVQSNTRNVIAQLTSTLREAGIDEIILKARNSIAIDPQKVSCDYYDYLRGHATAVNAYMGEYMSDYSWAEFTIAYLNDRLK